MSRRVMARTLGTLDELDFLFLAIGPPRVGDEGRERGLVVAVGVVFQDDVNDTWEFRCMLERSLLDGDSPKPFVVAGMRLLASMSCCGALTGAGTETGGSGIEGCSCAE